MGFFDFLIGGGPTREHVSAQTLELVRRDWEEIDVLLKNRGPSQLRQALIKADKSLDNVLKEQVVGENMGERLKNAKNSFDYQMYDKIWKAHKMRNSLVHESGYEPPYHMIEGGISDLRNALSKLGVNV